MTARKTKTIIEETLSRTTADTAEGLFDSKAGVLRLPLPEPPRRAIVIVPLFLGFAGCPHRCVYCDQPVGQERPKTPRQDVCAQLEQTLTEKEASSSGPIEVALYGGTFTALPGDLPERLLQRIEPRRRSGLVSAVRCSTRPDAVSLSHLSTLKALGLDMVELGLQSLDADVLLASGRGYKPQNAVEACRIVREAGLGLGVQLLPGLPGSTAESFMCDVERVAALQPDCVRLYPCLALANTELAKRYAAGEYSPWSLQTTVDALGQGLDLLWSAGIPVIRTGLHPQTTGVVAGPTHPALGQMIRSRAFHRHIRRCVEKLAARPGKLFVPRRLLSDIYGHGKEMLPAYGELGIGESSIIAWDEATFGLSFDP